MAKAKGFEVKLPPVGSQLATSHVCDLKKLLLNFFVAHFLSCTVGIINSTCLLELLGKLCENNTDQSSQTNIQHVLRM